MNGRATQHGRLLVDKQAALKCSSSSTKPQCYKKLQPFISTVKTIGKVFFIACLFPFLLPLTAAQSIETTSLFFISTQSSLQSYNITSYDNSKRRHFTVPAHFSEGVVHSISNNYFFKLENPFSNIIDVSFKSAAFSSKLHNKHNDSPIMIHKHLSLHRLSKRAESDDVAKKYHFMDAFVADGLHVMIYAGFDRVPVLAAIDTSFENIVLNPRNETFAKMSFDKMSDYLKHDAMFGFDKSNSLKFQDLDIPLNRTSLMGEEVSGLFATDELSMGIFGVMANHYAFVYSSNNQRYYNNKYNRFKPVTSISQHKSQNSSGNSASFQIPANILGFANSQDSYSFLQQAVSKHLIYTRLFSIAPNFNDDFTVLLGAVDIARYDGVLQMQPILKHINLKDNSKTGWDYPFITLTGLSLTKQVMINNNDNGNNYFQQETEAIRFSEYDISLPVLLDTSSLLSFLPYDLVVYLASHIGAFYSAPLQAWIQDCNYRLLNGTIDFEFYNVTISIPLNSILIPLTTQSGKTLYLETGEHACALAFLPSESRGFCSLGTPFFGSSYTLFDYQNMMVGLASIPWFKREYVEPEIRVVYDLVGRVVNVSTVTIIGEPPTATISKPSTEVYPFDKPIYKTLVNLRTDPTTTLPENLEILTNNHCQHDAAAAGETSRCGKYQMGTVIVMEAASMFATMTGTEPQIGSLFDAAQSVGAPLRMVVILSVVYFFCFVWS